MMLLSTFPLMILRFPPSIYTRPLSPSYQLTASTGHPLKGLCLGLAPTKNGRVQNSSPQNSTEL